MSTALAPLARKFEKSTAILSEGVEICDAAEGLAAINNPETELIIWRRTLPLCLHTLFNELDARRFPEIRVLIRPDDLRHAFEPHLIKCGIPQGEVRDLLLEDVNSLALAFSIVAETDLVDVRLEYISHDACWKFHRDWVEARLITTYIGPTTEWVLPSHAEQALSEQKKYTGPIQRLLPQDVAIFKGVHSEQGNGIVHRSPPIIGTGHSRLLLCLNKPSMTSPKTLLG